MNRHKISEPKVMINDSTSRRIGGRRANKAEKENNEEGE
jgi:hypothetical protein